MKGYSLADITKVIGKNLANLRYNNQLIEAQRKLVNPTFLEILEELNKDDEVLAASLMNWYMNKYGKNLGSDIELTKLILEKSENKNVSSLSFGASCGDDWYHNDRC
jgi:hypothetical protein